MFFSTSSQPGFHTHVIIETEVQRASSDASWVESHQRVHQLLFNLRTQ